MPYFCRYPVLFFEADTLARFLNEGDVEGASIEAEAPVVRLIDLSRDGLMIKGAKR